LDLYLPQFRFQITTTDLILLEVMETEEIPNRVATLTTDREEILLTEEAIRVGAAIITILMEEVNREDIRTR
jgi:hypothetical protein